MMAAIPFPSVPMRYSREHKQQTRERILARAAERLRKDGIDGVGVADLMKDVGLTHGGFYAHFESKEDLVIAAFTSAMDASRAKWDVLLGEGTEPDRLIKLAAKYLSPSHRDHAHRGCAVPALAGDMTRASPRVRDEFADRVSQMIDTLATAEPLAGSKDPQGEAIHALSTMVGALLLARSVGTGALSDRILEAGRERVAALSEATSEPSQQATIRQPKR